MIVKTLIENTSKNKHFRFEHGLSIYIEFLDKRILFDLGSSSLFVENANKLGIDLSKIDFVVISHGHYDHGGGLKAFLEINHTAKVFVNKYAYDQYFSLHNEGMKYIGLDHSLKTNSQITFVGNNYQVWDNVFLFSNVIGIQYFPLMNKSLYRLKNKKYILDDFIHEQNLLIKDQFETVLFIGCGHRGVVNIMEYVRTKYNLIPTHVIGGFHMSNRNLGIFEEINTIQEVAKFLKKSNSLFYTGHCTGNIPHQILKKRLGNKLQKMSAGKTLISNLEENL